MAIDIQGGSFKANIETTDASWPKCHQCSVRLQRAYPVESMGFAGAERPKQVGDKMEAIVDVECHGAKQTFALSHPVWWGEAHLHNALGRTWAFVKSGRGEYKTAVMRGRGGMK